MTTITGLPSPSPSSDDAIQTIVNLPHRQTAATTDPVPGTASSAASLKRILLVDDEAHVLRVMRLALDRNGYEVDTALDAEVALRMLGERRYEVMIVDAGLGEGDGGRLCETVRERHGEAAMLLLLTCAGDEPVTATAPGVERVEKPLSLRWIVARLNEYFGDYERGA